MGTEIPKQYLPLAGRTVIEHTLARLCSHPDLTGVVVTLAAGDEYWSHLRMNLPIPIYPVAGGSERVHSVQAGLFYLETLAAPDDWILVHDAARPCLRPVDLQRLVAALVDHPVGGLLALPISDTVKRANTKGEVLETVPRQELWRALTPQMFRLKHLCAAITMAITQGWTPTDESAAMEMEGYRPLMVAGHADNIKITHYQDLKLAELFLSQKFLK
ncbi:2-C-methyl-D-erythritol 4-phosphate cytidylyltransferase [Gammaproteobacteria bacterium]